jgi:hypothetical protein
VVGAARPQACHLLQLRHWRHASSVSCPLEDMTDTGEQAIFSRRLVAQVTIALSVHGVSLTSSQ